MHKLLVAIALCFAFATSGWAENIVGPPNAIFCNKNANTAVTTGTVQVVASSGNTVINICGYVLAGATAAGTVQLVYGSGATCTTPTTLTVVLTTIVGNVLQDHFSYAWVTVPAGQSVCAVITATASVSVYYSQF